MKLLGISLLAAVVLVLSSCKKDEPAIPTSLIGKWELYDNYYSIGGPLIYVKHEGPNVYLDFESDGTLSSNDTDYKAYSLKDSITLRFIKKDHTIEDYSFSIENGLLNLSLAGCIEGCGSRYKKVK